MKNIIYFSDYRNPNNYGTRRHGTYSYLGYCYYSSSFIDFIKQQFYLSGSRIIGVVSSGIKNYVVMYLRISFPNKRLNGRTFIM